MGDSLSVLAGAWLLRSWPGPPLRFRQLRDVAGLLLALVVGSLLSATSGATAVTLGLGRASFGWQWLMWYLGDVLGGMMAASLVLAWGAPERGRSRRPSHPWELGVTVAGLVLLAHVLFSEPKPQGILVSLPYACLPAVLWMAVRHGPRGATLGTVVVGTLAAWHTAAGRGPFGSLHAASAVTIPLAAGLPGDDGPVGPVSGGAGVRAPGDGAHPTAAVPGQRDPRRLHG